MEEEGRLSEAWQSPLQRRLASDFDEPVHGLVHAGRSPIGSATKNRIDGAGRLRGAAAGEQTHRGDARGPSGAAGDSHETLSAHTRLLEDQANVRSVETAKFADKAQVESDGPVHGLHTYFQSGGGENDLAHDRDLRSQARDHSCPLIYAVDAVTAKEHGLHLFQVRIKLVCIELVSYVRAGLFRGGIVARSSFASPAFCVLFLSNHYPCDIHPDICHVVLDDN